MVFLGSMLVAFGTLFLSPLVAGRVVQLPDLDVPSKYQQDLGDVRKIFVTSYESYQLSCAVSTSRLLDPNPTLQCQRIRA
jgi:hypothetical protein